MLSRAFRITDKIGVLLLKVIMGLSELTLAGLAVIAQGLLALVGLIIGVVNAIFPPLRRRTQRVAERANRAAEQSRSNMMARRAARVEMEVGVAEDPLRAQNRVLSGLLIVVLVALIGVVLWATDPSNRAPNTPLVQPIADAGAFNNAESPLVPTAVDEPVTLPSPVPTATPLPSILEVRGTLAYVVRERGQTDIWALPVGSQEALRLTNSPVDERDPAWSPDGQRLAYAGQQDGNWEIYIYDLNSGETSRMTFDLSFQAGADWSPDGQWLVYESYQGNNLDIYAMRIDGSQTPIRFTDDPGPDFSPAWSPDGRRVAFVSWREGNQDIYLFSLDDQSVVNLTSTPDRAEDHPVWSPDGELIAYSALDQGLEKVFVKSSTDVNAAPQVLERGRTPAWSPDGASLVAAVDSVDSTHLVASPFAVTGIATEIIPVLRGASSPSWTGAPLPQAIINAGGQPLAITEPLFIEQENPSSSEPFYRLSVLRDISAPNAVLSERVNDSFQALREAANDAIGYDFLGQLEDAFWQIDRPPQPGEERRNWHMTGRAFAINRNAIVGFPPPIEIVREDIGVSTYWRVFVRVADDAGSGQLGEPLRHMPWDFASRSQGDVEAYDQGGRLRDQMPQGYYVDLTQLAADYGWDRVPTGSDWRANFNSINYWLFQKRDGLDWYTAMRELYTQPQLGGFAPQATDVPGNTTGQITVNVDEPEEAAAEIDDVPAGAEATAEIAADDASPTVELDTAAEALLTVTAPPTANDAAPAAEVTVIVQPDSAVDDSESGTEIDR